MNTLERMNMFLNRILLFLGSVAVLLLMSIATINAFLRIPFIKSTWRGAYETVGFLEPSSSPLHWVIPKKERTISLWISWQRNFRNGSTGFSMELTIPLQRYFLPLSPGRYSFGGWKFRNPGKSRKLSKLYSILSYIVSHLDSPSFPSLSSLISWKTSRARRTDS